MNVGHQHQTRQTDNCAQVFHVCALLKSTGAPDPHTIEAAKVGAGRTAIPDFGTDRDPDMTDFNDMAVICWLEAVASALASTSEPARGDIISPKETRQRAIHLNSYDGSRLTPNHERCTFMATRRPLPK